MGTLDWGLLIVRVVAGLIFAAHGAQKAFGWWSGPGLTGWQASLERMGIRPARPWALLSAGTELLGGLALALGFLTPLATALLAGLSIVIIGRVHLPHGLWNKDGGIEFPLTLAAIVAAVLLVGPGAASLDRLLQLDLAPAARAGLLLLGVLGGMAALAVPRLAPKAPLGAG